MPKEFKYTLCTKCGQVGLPLVNVAGYKEPAKYVCRDTVLCTKRRGARAGKKGLGCSVWYCYETAVLECSCGMRACTFHAENAIHRKHQLHMLDKQKAPALG